MKGHRMTLTSLFARLDALRQRAAVARLAMDTYMSMGKPSLAYPWADTMMDAEREATATQAHISQYELLGV